MTLFSHTCHVLSQLLLLCLAKLYARIAFTLASLELPFDELLDFCIIEIHVIHIDLRILLQDISCVVQRTLLGHHFGLGGETPDIFLDDLDALYYHVFKNALS